jgi:hypothetical protein
VITFLAMTDVGKEKAPLPEKQALLDGRKGRGDGLAFRSREQPGAVSDGTK